MNEKKREAMADGRAQIYMDHAATTELLPEVHEAMEPYLTEEYGNASTSYDLGKRNRKAIEDARSCIADVIDADSSEIYFTSGGSESDNWAIKCVAETYRHKGKHIITSKIEPSLFYRDGSITSIFFIQPCRQVFSFLPKQQ